MIRSCRIHVTAAMGTPVSVQLSDRESSDTQAQSPDVDKKIDGFFQCGIYRVCVFSVRVLDLHYESVGACNGMEIAMRVEKGVLGDKRLWGAIIHI